MKLDHISPSELNNFSSCPKKWYFSKTKTSGIAVPEGKRTFGKAVHEAIKSYYQKVPDKPTQDDIETAAIEAFDEVKPFLRSFKVKAIKVLSNFIEFEKKRLKTWGAYKPLLVEKWMETKLFDDLPPMRTIVDFFGSGVCIDWKTSAGYDEDRLRQGKIYQMVLERSGHKVDRVTFLNLDTGTNLPVPRVTDGWIYKEIQRMVDMTNSERFPSKPSGLCPWCEYELDCECADLCLWM